MTSTSYVVRRGGTNDAMMLRAIRLESLLDTPEAYGSTYDEASTWSDDRWRTAARQWHFYLAECDDEVVGMVSGGLNDVAPGTHWMYGMYVSPVARSTGVAASLVEATCDWAVEQGADALYLHVTESVARARVFYERSGFLATGVTITMDRDPSIRLMTMVKSLV
jgi:GNAT superfamily N-acetyltransferase